jgi:hypothetical protein
MMGWTMKAPFARHGIMPHHRVMLQLARLPRRHRLHRDLLPLPTRDAQPDAILRAPRDPLGWVRCV